MEVISKPDINNWSTQHKCNICDTELKINQSDLIYEYRDSGPYSFCGSHDYRVKCPICNKLSYVQHSDIPKLVQFEVRDSVENFLMEKSKKSFFRRLFS